MKPQRLALRAGSLAHALHDGLTDAIYVLLPIWQSQFALSYAAVGLLRGVYAGCMAGFQIQASKLAKRFGRRALLVGGTAVAGVAYLIAGQAGGLIGVAAALALGGLGASTQHPLASAMVAQAHEGNETNSRTALATYNFAGDIGKMALPAALGLLLSGWSWRTGVSLIGVLGLVGAVCLFYMIPALQLLPLSPATSAPANNAASGSTSSTGFRALLATGIIDSATRMGFLSFLPFVLQAKGATTATIGMALALLFIGGAAGKLVCGYLGKKLGMLKTVWLTETLTAVLVLIVLSLPLTLALAALPILGVALNGTSSVLYGSVPELVPPPARERAFALFYTGTIGSGAIAPLVFGALGDHVGIPQAMACVAAFVCLTLPLAWIVNFSQDME